MDNVRTHYRTHSCGELRMEHVGQTVTLAGFLENFREVGANLGFLVLRDFYGTTQVVAETEEMVKTIKALNKESAVQQGIRRPGHRRGAGAGQQEPQAAHRRHRGGAPDHRGAGPLPPQRAALPGEPQPGG